MKKKEINNFFRDKKRNTDEMRKVSLEVDYVKTCAGSALFRLEIQEFCVRLLQKKEFLGIKEIQEKDG